MIALQEQATIITDEEQQYLAAMRRRTLWARLRRERLAIVSLVVILVFVMVAALAPWLAPHNPNFAFNSGLDASGTPLGSTAQYPLGTDIAGRDVLSRLMFGARISLTVGVTATLLQVLIGVTVGAIAGYFGGWIEVVIMRLVDVMLALPGILLGLAAAAIFGPSVPIVILVIAATQWMGMTRVIYGLVQSLKEWEFVTAARAVGVGSWRIMWRHLAPHLAPVVITLMALGVGYSILIEAGLSFLNAGVPLPTASWGSMVGAGVEYYRIDPALVLYPGLVLAIVVLAFTLLGDGLMRALEGR